MKRSCKHIDITNWKVVYPWVRDCINKHCDRYDFKRMLRRVGGLPCDFKSRSPDDQAFLWEGAVITVAKYAAGCIKNRELNLTPVSIRGRQDTSSLKWRYIGKESAEQQIFDAIAVKAADEVWERRIVPQQSSSIKGRGQVYGTAMISRWLKKDWRAARYAKTRKLKYSRKCRFFVKLDVKQCYQSMRRGIFMLLFRKDCANEDLLWLWNTLLLSHNVIVPELGERYQGFMIGALPSQQAAQYMLSFVYRFALSLKKSGKKIVSHMELFMDDMLLFTSSKNDLKFVANKIVRYSKTKLGINIKPNWQICDIQDTPVDMMGFRIHSDGNVTTRSRIFLRVRRVVLRVKRKKNISHRQAKRISSYKGYFFQRKKQYVLPFRVTHVAKKLDLWNIFKRSAHIVGRWERRKYGSNLLQRTECDQLYAAA